MVLGLLRSSILTKKQAAPHYLQLAKKEVPTHAKCEAGTLYGEILISWRSRVGTCDPILSFLYTVYGLKIHILACARMGKKNPVFLHEYGVT